MKNRIDNGSGTILSFQRNTGIYQGAKVELSRRQASSKPLSDKTDRKKLDQGWITTYLLNLKKPKVKEYQNIKLSQNGYRKFFQDKAKESQKGL